VGALTAAGAVFVGGVSGLPAGVELVVTSPGWRPDHPLLADAAAHGVEVVGEPELAWRLRDPAVPWLAVTGTNGKTTTVTMRGARVAVADAGDPVAASLVAGHPHAVTVTLGEPDAGQLGVRDGALVDRAFAADPAGEVLLDAGGLQVAGPHNVVNALAAAALA